MRILTFVKSVPTAAATPRVGETGDRIDDADLAHQVNEPDLYAIEEGVHQAGLLGGEVAVATIGPARARDALHVALAKGAKAVVHVADEADKGANPAANLAAAAYLFDKMTPDLVLCGVQAEDDMQGHFGARLAERLGLPLASAVTAIAIDAARREATVVRELGAGYREELSLALPCVLSIQFGIRPLRYTSIMSIVKMKRHPVETIDIGAIAAAAAGGVPRPRAIALAVPESRSRCEMLTGSPDEAARQLLKRLLDRGALANAR